MHKSHLALTLSIFGWIWGPPSETGEGRLAYERGEYQAAYAHYALALEDQGRFSARINFNLGLCYNRLDSLQLAKQCYSLADRPGEDELASLALNNLGVLSVRDKKLKEALGQFQDALRRDPKNSTARFNYELIRHLLDVPPPPENPPPDSTPPPPNPKPKPQEGAGNNDGQSSIPLDSARKQLEALRQKEKTFIQELKKKINGHPKPHGSADL
jgi:tetratricopeptide (TPR) repeat protein